MLNRSAIVVRPKPPFVAWLNGVENDPVDEASLKDRTVYLIPDFDFQSGYERIFNEVWPLIFERELEAWYTDETLWPQQRTLALFNEWFSVEVHEIIEDLCDSPLVDDELCG